MKTVCLASVAKGNIFMNYKLYWKTANNMEYVETR